MDIRSVLRRFERGWGGGRTLRIGVCSRFDPQRAQGAGELPILAWRLGHPGGWLLRGGSGATPYDAELIREDVRRAREGDRLEITVPAHATEAEAASVQARFARLGDRGVTVRVLRESDEIEKRPHVAA